MCFNEKWASVVLISSQMLHRLFWYAKFHLLYIDVSEWMDRVAGFEVQQQMSVHDSVLGLPT